MTLNTRAATSLFDLAFSPNGAHIAAVCGYGLNEIVLVDLANNKKIKSLPAGRFPYFIDISPDEKIAVVGNPKNTKSLLLAHKTPPAIARAGD